MQGDCWLECRRLKLEGEEAIQEANDLEMFAKEVAKSRRNLSPAGGAGRLQVSTRRSEECI